MVRIAGALALMTCLAATAQAEQLTFAFEGTITSVIDGSATGGPALDFHPIPVGSSFSGIYSYDVDSPVTDGGNGYRRYLDMLSSGGTVFVNGHQFDSAGGSAIVVSQEAGFSYSGMAISNQPASVPEGWIVPLPAIAPYFTTRFEDATPQPRPLTLPASGAEIATGKMVFVLDFLHGVTVDGVEYDTRVFITGKITTLNVLTDPPPPLEAVVDVEPASAGNKINLNAKKPKPLDVAVFGAPDFDALSVVPETIELGDPLLTDPEFGDGQKAAPTDVDIADVDGDGALDLLLTFDLLEMQALGAIDSSSDSLAFHALTSEGGLVFGSDAVSVAGSKGKRAAKGKK